MSSEVSLELIWRWIWWRRKTRLEWVEMRTVLILLSAVPLDYLAKLVPPEKEFPLFRDSYYLDLQEFFCHFFTWLVLAILSTRYFFLCKRRWGLCLGALAFNYWWMALCSLGWGVGILQEGEQLYMLPLALVGFYPLWRYRSRWRRRLYKGKTQTDPWRGKDYWVGAVILICASLTHVYLLFPQTPDFYFIHSGWFKNVQNFVFFFSIAVGAILWIGIWFFDCDRWYHPYIAWPLTMFIFKFIGMIAVEFGIASVSQAYCYMLPLAALLTSALYRARKSLYMSLYRKELKVLGDPDRFVFWRDWFLLCFFLVCLA